MFIEYIPVEGKGASPDGYVSCNPCRAKIRTYFVVKSKNLNKLVDAG